MLNQSDPQLVFLYQKIGDAYALRRETHAEAHFLLATDPLKAGAKLEPIQKTLMMDVLDDLRLFYLDFKHYDKAEKCLMESLDTRIELLGENHATVAYSYTTFGVLHPQRQEYNECVTMCEAALDMHRQTSCSNVQT